MKLSDIQHYAIQAHMAGAVGAEIFDKVFASVRYDDLHGNMLYVSARDKEAADEVASTYSRLEIASIVLETRIGVLIVLPKVLQ
jgi:hypothetical protein